MADIVQWFGSEVSRLSRNDPDRARRLLLAGFRANYATLFLPGPLPPVRRFAAQQVMRLMLAVLQHPERTALVSLFVPPELLQAAGLQPYSLEAITGYLMGSQCETHFQACACDAGMPETLCSFHRGFLGAAETGLVRPPRCVIYTSLACDGNMITFPYLREKYGVPAFFIDVPYEKSEDAVHETANRLREARVFLQDTVGRLISEEALRQAVARSAQSTADYRAYLKLIAARRLNGDCTGEMYLVFMARLLLGGEIAQKYFADLRRAAERAPLSQAKRLLWVHVIPYMQPAVRDALSCSDRVFITTSDLACDAILETPDPAHPYESMARRLVYSGFNGAAEGRIERALRMAETTRADGAVIFAHWGCKSTLGAVQLMKQALENAGLPTLVLDGDAGCPANSGDGQIATRLQAFLEMLEGRV